ncbi:MAG: apolipoprotein N-acyltransferase, partial [Gammaproteobacteria bacterium]|nr:apolipoprotein N-acyltransferase [Gammaproteobacteria bacterium]
FGGSPVWLAVIITFIFVTILALYYALQGWLAARFFQRQSMWVKCFLLYPALWVVFEWLRGWLFTGFPWLFIGYSQLYSPLAGFAPVLSVYGVGLAVAYIAASLALLANRTGYFAKTVAVFIIISLAAVGFGLTKIHWTQSTGKALTVSLVQGNIKQKLKWQPQEIRDILQTYKKLTAKHWRSDLIIWPEAAIPALPSQVMPFLAAMNRLGKRHHTTLIYGEPTYDPVHQAYYNAMFLAGQNQGVYYKRHLVPFGEYTPMLNIFKPLLSGLNIPMSDLSKGPEKQVMLMLGKTKIAAFICYEIAYPEAVRKYTQDTGLIISITDDSWFGQSIARDQHLQIAQMRALETGRYVLLASNNGITAIIKPNGRVLSALAPDKAGVLTGKIQLKSGSTPFLQHDNWALMIIVLGLLLLAIFAVVVSE